MGDLFEYLNWRGDLTFEECAFTEVDGLILSAFSYIEPPKKSQSHLPITLHALSASMKHLSKDARKASTRNENDIQLLDTLASCKRFCDVEILRFVNQIDHQNETQFAAYCLRLDANTLAIVYRGTDHSIIGWKEDFNMSFLDKIPGQITACDFLKDCAASFTGDLYLCGHSKGGNLAVYSATTCPTAVHLRIRDVYNYDGPGFAAKFVKRASFQRMCGKMHTFVPESSIVGTLFIHEEPFEFVASRNSGIAQHEPYSWELMGGSLIRAKQSNSGGTMDEAITQWMAGMNKKEREAFVESLFGLLDESDAKRLEDITSLKTLFAAGKQYSNYSEKEKSLLSNSIKNFRQIFSDTKKARKKTKNKES